MRETRSRLSIAFHICLVLGLLEPACEPVENVSCARGDVSSCKGLDGCAGSRRCGGEPASWSTCSCENPSPDASQDAAEAGTAEPLGEECEQSSDCPSGAFCLGTDNDQLFGGAPPKGICVADCGGESSSCGQFAKAVCVATGGDAGAAFCFARCALGATDEAKCEHTSAACAPIGQDDEGAFCRPMCTTDADCDSGSCDPAHGVCVSNSQPDRSFGLRCGSGADTSAVDAGIRAATCDGLCVELNDGPLTCTRRCVFGSSDECAPASGGLRRGGCLFATASGGIGDVGFCGELCDCDDDCIEPSFVCDAFDDPVLEQSFERKGVCTDPSLATTHALSCEI